MRLHRTIYRYEKKVEPVLDKKKQKVDEKKQKEDEKQQQEYEKTVKKLHFDEHGILKIRPSLCDYVKNLLQTKGRSLFYQRVFIVTKNLSQPPPPTIIPVHYQDPDRFSTSKPTIIETSKDFKQAFEQRFRKLIANCYKLRVVDDIVTGLFVYMGDFSLLIIESADVMLGDLMREFAEIVNEWFECSRIFLVEDNIDDPYFQSFVTRRAVAPLVNEKFPPNTPNDFSLMTEQHLIVREKLTLLCKTLSDHLYNPPSINSEEEELEEEESNDNEYEEEESEKQHFEKVKHVTMQGVQIIEDETYVKDDKDANAEKVEKQEDVDQTKSVLGKVAATNEDEEDELDDDEQDSEEGGNAVSSKSKAKSPLYAQEEEMGEEEEVEEEQSEELPFEELDEEKFMQDIDNIDMFELTTEPPFKIESELDKEKVIEKKESSSSINEEPLVQATEDEKNKPTVLDDMLPPAEYIKILPEIQRLEFILNSNRYYQTVERFAGTYMQVPVQVDEETLLWPPEFEFVPVNVFKRGPFDVNLTFGDYKFEDDDDNQKGGQGARNAHDDHDEAHGEEEGEEQEPEQSEENT